MYPEVSVTENTQDPQGLLNRGIGRCCGLKGFFSTLNNRTSKKKKKCVSSSEKKRSLPLQPPFPSETDKSTAGNKEISPLGKQTRGEWEDQHVLKANKSSELKEKKKSEGKKYIFEFSVFFGQPMASHELYKIQEWQFILGKNQ